MPKENLEALRAFIRERREPPPKGGWIRAALNALPEETKRRLSAFLHEVQQTKYFQPDGNPRPEWRMFSADSWRRARGEAHLAADAEANKRGLDSYWLPKAEMLALSAKLEWLYVHKLKKEPLGASILMRIVEDIARKSAEGAMPWVETAVLKDAGANEPKAASETAGMLAFLLTLSDLGIEGLDKQLARMSARWEVWRKGYGLAGEIDGVLYVYCKGEVPK